MKIKYLDIDGQIFSYEDESDILDAEGYVGNPISEEDGKILLETTKSLFDEIGLDFYLAYGTLLGAVRDHGIIKGDQDVDVYIFNEQKLYKNIPFLLECNYKLIRYYPGKLFSFRIKGNCYIDVYILRPLKYFSLWSVYCYSICGYSVPKKYFKCTQEIMFLGKNYKCPAQPEKLLEFWYGSNWRIPMQSKPHEEVRSAEIFHNFCRRFIPVAKIKSLLKIK